MNHPQILKRAGRPDIAYYYNTPAGTGMNLPPVVFLGGFKSDMAGTKAVYLEQVCQQRGQAYLRLDYSGHGVSGGLFEEGTIGDWKDDALAVLDYLEMRAAILVGSSMGGWISLLITVQRPDIVSAFIGIAAAPDFTDDIWFNRLNEAQRAIVDRDGYVAIPNDYSDEPYIITRNLIQNGRKNFVLGRQQSSAIPMALLQGLRDDDVDAEMPERIKSAFPFSDIDIILINDGDHRLSRPEDLALLDEKIRQLSGA